MTFEHMVDVACVLWGVLSLLTAGSYLDKDNTRAWGGITEATILGCAAFALLRAGW